MRVYAATGLGLLSGLLTFLLCYELFGFLLQYGPGLIFGAFLVYARKRHEITRRKGAALVLISGAAYYGAVWSFLLLIGFVGEHATFFLAGALGTSVLLTGISFLLVRVTAARMVSAIAAGGILGLSWFLPNLIGLPFRISLFHPGDTFVNPTSVFFLYVIWQTGMMGVIAWAIRGSASE